MKAIIPIAGAGKRLRPFTYTQPKPLIPVGGKPILSYIIDQLLQLGVSEFVFVIGYLGKQVRDYLESDYPDLPKHFVTQFERKGSGHAVWLAHDALGDVEEVLIVFGDTILEGSLQHIVECDKTCIAIKPVEDPRRFGVVETDEEGDVVRMVEKPQVPRSNRAMVGFYKVNDYPLLHKTLGKVLAEAEGSAREVTLTDGLMALLDGGHPMHAEHIERWYDCGNPDVLLATNRRILDKRGYAETQAPAFDGTVIIHPVAIGRGCQIHHAIIGPYVSIGDNVHIERAIVSDSIIGNNTGLYGVSLTESIVGNDTKLNGRSQTINIGESTELTLG